ncbi:Hypothetical predicted protein, partial [Pelobates cultripes]
MLQRPTPTKTTQMETSHTEGAPIIEPLHGDREAVNEPDTEPSLSLQHADSSAPTTKGDLKILLADLRKMMAADLVPLRTEIQANTTRLKVIEEDIMDVRTTVNHLN